MISHRPTIVHFFYQVVKGARERGFSNNATTYATNFTKTTINITFIVHKSQLATSAIVRNVVKFVMSTY